MLRRQLAVCASVCLLSLAVALPALAGDVVLRTSSFKNVHGNWAIGSDSSAADGQYMGSADYGWSTTNAPIAQPNDYFEATFDAPAGTPYHVWFRLRASGNSKWNDSVWVQYSDAIQNGAAVYRIGTTSALDVNLERCSGCGDSGWGWQDSAYWLSQATTIQFSGSSTHTLRVQIREDGVQIDQIVLSPATYLYSSPGQMTNDTVIVPLSGGTATATTAAGPYLGSPVSLPGRIEAENFDLGADGVSYHDSDAGNAGGAYRQTNADIENCSEGGYDVGWIQAGEWMNYAVKVATAGSYTVNLRVASPSGGGSLHLGFNGPSNVWQTVAIPATGSWQSWTTVSVPVTLGAGSQLMTLSYDSAGFNINYIDVASASVTSSGGGTGGTGVTVVTWNIQVNDSSAAHAQGAIDRMMSMTPRPQVVVIEEAHQSQYNTYISELQARSGQTWQGAFRTHCPPGAWNGSTCTGSEDEGVAVFTSLPIVSSSTAFLPYPDQYHSARALVRVAVNASGVVLQVFGTHLQLDTNSRAQSMSYIKSYASGYSTPQILAGDLNGGPSEIDASSGLLPNFVDGWTQCASGNGYTYTTSSPYARIDYWLADPSGRAKPNWSVVVTATGTFSDHYPLINNFTVK